MNKIIEIISVSTIVATIIYFSGDIAQVIGGSLILSIVCCAGVIISRFYAKYKNAFAIFILSVTILYIINIIAYFEKNSIFDVLYLSVTIGVLSLVFIILYIKLLLEILNDDDMDDKVKQVRIKAKINVITVMSFNFLFFLIYIIITAAFMSVFARNGPLVFSNFFTLSLAHISLFWIMVGLITLSVYVLNIDKKILSLLMANNFISIKVVKPKIIVTASIFILFITLGLILEFSRKDWVLFSETTALVTLMFFIISNFIINKVPDFHLDYKKFNIDDIDVISLTSKLFITHLFLSLIYGFGLFFAYSKNIIT